MRPRPLPFSTYLHGQPIGTKLGSAAIVMSDVGQMEGAHRLVPNFHRRVRLFSTLKAIQEILEVRRGIGGPARNVLTDRCRRFPPIVTSFAPRFGERPITVLAKLQCSLLTLKHNTPALHEGVNISERPGASKLWVLENRTERVRRLCRLQLVNSAVGLGRDRLRHP